MKGCSEAVRIPTFVKPEGSPPQAESTVRAQEVSVCQSRSELGHKRRSESQSNQAITNSVEASQRSQPSFMRKVPTFRRDAINAKHLSSFRSQLVGFGGRLRVRDTRSTPSVRKQPRESSADARRRLKAGRIVRMEGWMDGGVSCAFVLEG